jgi:hypothetical protein
VHRYAATLVVGLAVIAVVVIAAFGAELWLLRQAAQTSHAEAHPHRV